MKKGKKLLMFSASILTCALLPIMGSQGGNSSFGLIREVQKGNYENKGKFDTDFETYEDATKAADEHNLKLSEEGNTLLKNTDNALPMSLDSKLSVFGVMSDNLVGGGEDGVADSLEHAGFTVNPTLKRFYANDESDIGKENYTFNGSVSQSLALYNDAAVLVISRTGGEGADLSVNTGETVDADDTHKDLTTIDGKKYKHYLMLTDSEEALLEYIEARFDTVHVVINTSHIIEMGDLQDDPKVKSILWIGRPGSSGIDAVGKIYKGEVNPSGSVVDEWARDFTADPTWQNFGDNSQHEVTYGNVYRYENGKRAGSNSAPNSFPPLVPGWHGVDYEEGIYLGYRYYETVYSDMAKTDKAAAKEWYDANVVYPFGFGLNYTTFSFNAKGVFTDEACKTELGSAVTPDLFESAVGKEAKVKTFYIPVTVKNTGSVAGKKTVQVYVTAPYVNGETAEKSSVILAGFGKTDILEPGEEETITVSINVQDFASYDAKDMNHNGNKGYELDKGEYTIRVMDSAHFDVDTDISDTTDAYWETKFTLSDTTNLKLDDFSGNEVTNLFSEENGIFYSERVGQNKDEKANMTLLSRSDFEGTFPKAPTEADLTFPDEFYKRITEWECVDIDDRENYASWDDPSTKDEHPWVEEINVGENWTQNKDNGKYKLTDVSGIDPESDEVLTDGVFKGMTGKEAWETFMNSLTWDEMKTLPQNGGWSTAAIDSIGLEYSVDNDGPENFCSTHLWCDSPTISATFNTKLAEEQGIIIANLGMLKKDANLTGWYGPGMDTHRSPFSGRNNQYYSQDGVHGGYIAAAVVKGAESRGMITYSKHFALNDQETARDGELNMSWCTEQAIREIYVKPFQMAFQEGNASASMTAFARVGWVPSTVNYNFLTKMVRDQWGWDGYFVTDGYRGASKSSPLDLMVRGGNDMALENMTQGQQTEILVHYNVDDESKNETVMREDTLSGTWDASKRDGKGNVVVGENNEESDAQYYFVRKTVQRMLHRFANSVKTKNGIDMTKITGKEISLSQGVTLKDIDVKASTDVVGDATMRYELESGTLPDGVTLNKDGTLSGTPTTSGTFTVKIASIADNWLRGSSEFTFKVESAFSLSEGFEEATVGESYVGYIDSESVVTPTYQTVTYKLKDGEVLPDGLTLGEDGKVSGTPTKAGTFTFTVEIVATKVTSSGGPFSRTETYNFFNTQTITVKEKAVVEEPDDDKPSGDDTPTTEEPTQTTTQDNTLAVAGLVTGIIGIVVGLGAMLLNLFKKK